MTSSLALEQTPNACQSEDIAPDLPDLQNDDKI
jgi:hypothetical protein